jgi:flagellar basal body rod protein FlgG
MAESKKIVVNLPESMLKEFDEILRKDNKNRSEFIREAIILYIEEKRKFKVREMMKTGYLEMSNVNVVLEMVNLISNYRAYEVNAKTVQAHDQLLQKAVNEVGRV